ncbi:MAG: N-6 DNA methylase [Dehalococcoidales bacterium]|nr:N-6 DNA methylase [Dehalococcoidales bacterium]
MNEKLTAAYSAYLNDIAREYATGIAREHSYRAALKTLIENLEPGILAVNEPKRIDCGAPDYVIKRGEITIGYIEAKDIGANLNEIEKGEQLKRYYKPLSNLVLTDYLEFRWYVNGDMRLSARLGTAANNGKIKRDKEGIAAVAALLANFLSHTAEKVGTPRELAEKMARMAQMIRDLIIEAFNREEGSGALHSQLAAFQKNLIPDLSAEQFADMYAQTIAYGLFAARCTAPENRNFTRQNAAYMLPKTNPFLRKLFNDIAGPNLDDRIAWLVDDLAQVLAQADMAAVLKNFGKHSGKEDPVVHFYETFLKAYDPRVREMRGVYYTPEPVVSYIVRSIDYLLKTRFDKPRGLADDNTLILDPATGTATFLYNVVNEIHQSFAGQEGMWNDYVTEKLLKRLFGFELLMAPYAVAHLKLGLLLQETGYKFQSDERLGIYLTNTLDEAIKYTDTLFSQWISEEANSAAEIKKEKPIMVVLGNPPYSGNSANKGEWIRQLIETYKMVDGKPLGEKNPKMLQDDYVKFIRFGQWRIEKTGQGILGFITNHGYIDNITFRGMRQSLMNTFTDIYILNLHGNAKKKEVAPDGGKDENVFDIQQGVSVGIFVKEQGKDTPAKVNYADLWGLREGKYKSLFESDIATTEWTALEPNSPHYFFLPKGTDFKDEYNRYQDITKIFNIYSSGIKTHRDHFVIDYESTVLKNRITKFLDASITDTEIAQQFGLKNSDTWDVNKARQVVSQDKNYKRAFTDCLYRPFDIRPIFYHKALIDRSRPEVMHHMLAGNNLGLIAMRQVSLDEPYSHFDCTRLIVDNRAFYSNKGIQCLFPLYLYPAEGEMNFDGNERRPNLNPAFIKELEAKLGMGYLPHPLIPSPSTERGDECAGANSPSLRAEGDECAGANSPSLRAEREPEGEVKDVFTPEDIFDYAYAVFHSPTYRTRYAEFLKIDFPRLPLTSDKELFKALGEKGAELVSLHLMEALILNTLITRYPIDGSHKVGKVEYNEDNRRVYINKTQYFEGVPPEVWNFHIGGYQVCHKWLKDRKDRNLSYDERVHYQKVVVALKETIRLMEEIDDIIPGWPIE